MARRGSSAHRSFGQGWAIKKSSGKANSAHRYLDDTGREWPDRAALNLRLKQCDAIDPVEAALSGIDMYSINQLIVLPDILAFDGGITSFAVRTLWRTSCNERRSDA